jgi:hypothetical protein
VNNITGDGSSSGGRESRGATTAAPWPLGTDTRPSTQSGAFDVRDRLEGAAISATGDVSWRHSFGTHPSQSRCRYPSQVPKRKRSLPNDRYGQHWRQLRREGLASQSGGAHDDAGCMQHGEAQSSFVSLQQLHVASPASHGYLGQTIEQTRYGYEWPASHSTLGQTVEQTRYGYEWPPAAWDQALHARRLNKQHLWYHG